MFKDIRVILALFATLVLAVAVTLGGQTVLGWRDGYNANKQAGRTDKATTGVLKDGDQSAAARTTADQGGAKNRDEFDNGVQEAQTNEPETAVRDAGVVPASRLRAFEKRRLERERLARQRLASAGVQREEGPSSEDPPER